jgi:aspartyl protease family protein
MSDNNSVINGMITWGIVAAVSVVAFLYLFDGKLPSKYMQKSADVAHAAKADPDLVHGNEVQSFEERVELSADRRGHFLTNAYIDGVSVPVMVDTGASMVVLTYETAEDLGIAHSLEFTGRASTANGVAKVAPVYLDSIEIDGISVENVRAAVTEPGVMQINLLGMTFLSKLTRFEFLDRTMVMVQ